MTPAIAAFLFIFVIGLVLFAWERVPADVTALGLMLSLILTGLLSPADAFAGFGSETVLMILGLLILTETLVYTGLVDMTGRWILGTVGEDVSRLRWIMLIVPGIVSAVISNTAAAAFFLPIVLGLAHRLRISASQLLMPMAFAAILAGSVTLIGTSTNLVVSGLMQQQGLAPLSMFELTPVGLPILIAGILYMAFIGRKLIPDRTARTIDGPVLPDDLYFTEITLTPESPAAGKSIEESLIMRDLNLGVLALQRGDEVLRPLADTILTEGDTLLVEGKREDILRIPQTNGIEISGRIEELESYAQDGTTQVAEVVILPGSPLLGRTIRGLGLRERYKLQILAVNQAGDIRYSKIGRLTLSLGDVLLVQLPATNLRLLESEKMFRVLDIIETPPNDLSKARLASLIFIASLGMAVLGILPIAVAVLLGTLMAFLTRCITPEEAYRRIEWKTLILIGSMLAFGQAMTQTGTADYLAELIVNLPGVGSPFVLLTFFFFISVVLTQPMSNQAAAAVLVPIAIQTALLLGHNPRPVVIMIALAASCSFITPLEPASVIVYSAGRYRFMDFIRVGGLLTIVVYVIAILLVPLIWQA
ncbi:SLC13 family permease [Phototrophicus methaneseepsis]|uniref:SLC13 family permease n=1 Tax=Phototrophicus methaneseepsis TaxID=2710758 RepID=A0A7S8EAI1_9CHLR|nr:SLC13 family permease [Phototrophicus methaneseepsis]QPC83284.1 SLC13 family permease [Phototrophicus methaneseepsis]